MSHQELFRIRHFNRRCAGLSLALILLAVLGSHFVRPAGQDFGQYYMGGVVARAGLWHALYPRPIPGAPENAGTQTASTMHPDHAALAVKVGVGDANRFFQPPPAALLLAPLSSLSYDAALWIWLVAMSLAGWAAALTGAAVLTHLHGHPTRLSGVIVLLMTTSPLLYRTVRTGQISPLVALSFGIVLLGLLRQYRLARPLDHTNAAFVAAALVLGSLAKYATVVFLPLMLLNRYWRTLAWVVVFSVLVLAATYWFSGPEPFRVFVNDIMPTLGRSSAWRGNQSLQGSLIRTTGNFPLGQPSLSGLRLLQFAMFVGLLSLLWRRRRHSPGPVFVLSGSAALLCWLLMSAPVCWEHYFVYLFPWIGWLAWEARQGRVRAAVVLAAGALIWVPLAVVPGMVLPEPFASHMLAALLIILAFAVAKLWRCDTPASGSCQRVPGSHNDAAFSPRS